MKWKIATASVVAAAMLSAPVANAAPGNGNGNGARNTIGQTVSQIAKTGGGPAGILGALAQFKPGNTGLAKALQNALKPKPTPAPAPTPAS